MELIVIEVETLSSGIRRKDLHILQGIDGHTGPTDFSPGHRMIGVITDLGGQVKSNRKPVCPCSSRYLKR